MPQLHLPQASYDLSTIIGTIFQALLVALSYDVCVYILYDHPEISLREREGQSLRTKTPHSLCNLHNLCTKISQCQYDVLAGSLQLS